MTYQQQIAIRTRGHRDMHDITTQVAEIVAQSRIRTGIVNIFSRNQ